MFSSLIGLLNEIASGTTNVAAKPIVKRAPVITLQDVDHKKPPERFLYRETSNTNCILFSPYLAADGILSTSSKSVLTCSGILGECGGYL